MIWSSRLLVLPATDALNGSHRATDFLNPAFTSSRPRILELPSVTQY